MIIETILKSSLFPIMTEYLYNTGKEIWTFEGIINKLSALVLFLAGFLLTIPGIIILILIILLIVYKKEIFS